MDLATIRMPKNRARKAFLEYRAAVKERHTAEDEAIMQGYKALSLGKQVLNLREAIAAGGEDDRHRPRLAVARADVQVVTMHRYQNGNVSFISGNQWTVPTNATTKRIVFDRLFAWFETAWRLEATAQVPLVPAPLRPKGRLSNYHILWEANWQMRPPRDPALLKKLSGGLYAVVALWELSPLERAVLAMRGR